MESQIEKLKQEIQGYEEFQQMLEDQIKENEETMDKQKSELSSKDNEIKQLKKQLQDALKKADVLGNTDDVSGTRIIQLEVEIHDLNQKLQDSDLEMKQLKDTLKKKQEDFDLEIEVMKDDFQQKENEFTQQIENLKNQKSKDPKIKYFILQKSDEAEVYEEIERLTQEVQDKNQKIDILEKQIEKLQLQGTHTQIEEKPKNDPGLEEKISQLEELLLHYQEENQQLLQKEEKHEQEAKQQQDQIAQLQSHIEELQANEGPVEELENLKLQYEELVEEYTTVHEKLQIAEAESKEWGEKGQEYFVVKEQMQEQIQKLESQLQHHNEMVEENNELKILINKAKEEINNLESNNEYQTLFLQIRDEYEEFKEHVTLTLKEKEQQLYQAAQLCQEFDTFKEQALMLEQNNQLLTKQLQIQQENNEINQQKVEQLEEELNKTREEQSELTDIKLQLNQLKGENENLKQDNYLYSEMVKDYEIQMEALKQSECDSPRKISKLQQENSEATTELLNLKETTSREIHLLKQEKSQFQNENSEFKAMLDAYIASETFEPKIQYIIEYWNKLQNLQFQNENYELKAIIDAYISGGTFEPQVQYIIEYWNKLQKMQFQNENNELKAMLNAYIASEAFEPKVQYIIEYWNKLQNIQDEQNNLVEKFQMEIQELTENIGQIQSLQNLSVNNQEAQQPEELPQEENGFHLNLQKVVQQVSEKTVQTEQILLVESECQTDDVLKEQTPNIITQDTEIQTIELNTTEQDCQTDEGPFSEETKQIINQDDQGIIKQLIGQEADCNTSFDFAAIESLKKKVEDLDTLRAAQEKENQSLKEKIKKLEDKIASLQKPQTPRRQSDAKQESKKENEQIQRYQKQIKELQEQIEQFNAHQLNEQIEQQSNEIEQLQEELAQYREQLNLSRKKNLQYKQELETIYNLGPAALQQLRTEPKKDLPQTQFHFTYTQNLKDNINVLIQNSIESINKLLGRSVKVFSAVKGKIEKSIFDSYLFDEIFFDTQKIHQFLEGQRIKLQSENTRVNLILGQSKTHKKLIMIMLIELLYKAIAKLEIPQRITLNYQERIGKQWIELEQFNIETQTINELEYAIQNIKVHLLTKQKSEGEKIRKLQIVHQILYEQEVQSINQFLIVTCPTLPQGDFKTVVTKILNQQITSNYQFSIFLTLIPILQQYKQSVDILSMAKIAKQAKNLADFSSLTSSKSVSELITDDESQKQVRMANNKLILKQQEIEQQKKQIDLCRRQILEMQAKNDGLQGYLANIQSLINSLILDVKAKINLKMNQKKNKKSQNVAYLDKLAIQMDAAIRKSTSSPLIVDNNSERFKSKASEIINPFM